MPSQAASRSSTSRGAWSGLKCAGSASITATIGSSTASSAPTKRIPKSPSWYIAGSPPRRYARLEATGGVSRAPLATCTMSVPKPAPANVR